MTIHISLSIWRQLSHSTTKPRGDTRMRSFSLMQPPGRQRSKQRTPRATNALARFVESSVCVCVCDWNVTPSLNIISWWMHVRKLHQYKNIVQSCSFVECLIILHYSPVFIVYWSITCNHPRPHSPSWTRCPRGETIVVIPEPLHEVLSYYFTTSTRFLKKKTFSDCHWRPGFHSVYARRVDPSALAFSLASHRHSSITILFSSRFIDS